MNFKMPEMIFDGATFRISPRAIEGNGIIAKLEYIPNTSEVEARSDDLSRFFKKKISKSKFLERNPIVTIIMTCYFLFPNLI